VLVLHRVALRICIQTKGNNGKDQKQKDNTDKQMGICVVGVESPCNGDSLN
jgi:hypothetical protein